MQGGPPGIRRTDLWPGNFKFGMWVWTVHRLSGVVILLYLASHLVVISQSRSALSFDSLMAFFHRPYIAALELLLLAVIIFHTLNGLRIILFDMGVGIRRQKEVFWGFMAAGAVAMGLTVAVLWPRVSGG